MVCAVVVCAATAGTAFVGPAGAAASGHATAGPTRAVPAVAAQTTTAQTISWSIPITNTDLLPGTTSNLHIGNLYGDQYFIYDPVGDKLH